MVRSGGKLYEKLIREGVFTDAEWQNNSYGM